MSVALSKQFLQSFGIELADEQYEALSNVYEEMLNDRVTQAIVDELDDSQRLELSEYRQKSDEALQEWLKANIPDLSDIVESEIDILLGEIAENSDKL